MKPVLSLALLLSLAAPALAGDKVAPTPDSPGPGTLTEGPAPSAGPKSKGVGKPAPDFELTDTDGKPVKLSALRGKIVVLEWFNPGCPFVKHAHGQGALKDMAARWAKQGVVWLAINSNAPGKEGHGKDANAAARKAWAMAHPVLLDEMGVVGKAYGAKTTPHVFVIDPKGVLAYAGGLDDAPFGKTTAGAPVKPLLDQALGALKAGKRPATAETKPYGCSVKYGS